MLKGRCGGRDGEKGGGGRRLLLGLLRFIGPSIWIGRLGLGGPMPIAGDSSFLRKQKRRFCVFFQERKRRLFQSWRCAQYFYSILIDRKKEFVFQRLLSCWLWSSEALV
jgi:hypothetical protein